MGPKSSAMLCFFKYGSIDSKLTVLIIFAEKYIQSSEYIFNSKKYITLKKAQTINSMAIDIYKTELELGKR